MGTVPSWPLPMRARQVVLLTPSKSTDLSQLLSCKQSASLSPLFAALTSCPQLPVNTTTLSSFLVTHTDIALVSPVFATHTKTPGVYTNSSHFGIQCSFSALIFDLFLHALCPLRNPFPLTYIHKTTRAKSARVVTIHVGAPTLLSGRFCTCVFRLSGFSEEPA